MVAAGIAAMWGSRGTSGTDVLGSRVTGTSSDAGGGEDWAPAEAGTGSSFTTSGCSKLVLEAL